MRGRLLFVAGLGTGFVLGSRAGRRAYEQLRERAQTLSQNPAVQSTVTKARELAEQKAPKLTGALSAVTGTAASVTGSGQQAGGTGGSEPVGAEETGTNAAGGGEPAEGTAGVGPVGAEATESASGGGEQGDAVGSDDDQR